jgi:pyruvate dehydrogenase (quinone)
VLNNRDLNMVTWEQRVLVGDPKFDAAQHVPDFPYARYAELAGLQGIRVQDPEQIAPALATALSASRPTLIEAYVDADVPPLPPHVTLEQARAFTSALAKGDSDRSGIIRQTFRQVLDALAPGHHER